MKKSYQILKGLWTLAAVVLAGGLAGCQPDTPPVPSLPSLDILYEGAKATNLTLSYEIDGSITKVEGVAPDSFFEVESTRSWELTKSPSTAAWVTATPAKGDAGTVKVTVTVTPNSGEMQSATLIIKTADGSNIEKKVVVNQKGTTPVVEDAMPIADFRTTYVPQIQAVGGDDPSITLDKEIIFAGTVVSDASGANISDFLFALQDDTEPNSGVMINLTGHGLAAGDYVKVTCASGNKAMLYRGLLQVNATSVQKLGAETPVPITVTFGNIRTYESQFVKVENVQLKTNVVTTWGGNSGNQIFTNQAYETLTAYTKSSANFANTTVSTGSGYLLGLSGIYGTTIQIQPRNAGDVSHLTGTRFADQPAAKEGANILLQENMGGTEVSSNTNVNAFTGWQKTGQGAATVTYSTPTATGTSDATVRNTTKSSGYTKASSGNNVFFGTATSPTFIISNISLGGTTALYLGFGSNQTAANLAITYQEDGGTWKNLTYTKVSDSWDYVAAPITATAGTVLLSIKFAAVSGAQVRLDDVYVTTDQTYAQVYVPTVTSGDATVSGKNVTMNGSYTYDGPAGDITECGFAYGTSEAAMTEVAATAGAAFSKTAGPLAPGNYSWYAYVKKGGKTFEGATKTFIIEPDVVTTVTISSIVGGWVKDGLIDPGKQIKGTIVSDRTGANYSAPDSSFMIVDGTGDSSGMFVYLLKQDDGTTTATHTFNAGDQVVVNVGGAKMEEYNGLRQLTGVKLSGVTSDSSGTPKYDTPITRPSSADMDKYQSMLVKLSCTPSAAAIGQTWGSSSNDTSRTFEDSASADFTVFTKKTASYLAQTIPSASGTITGIVGQYNTAAQLMPRNINDIQLGTVVPQFSVSTQAVPVAAAGGNATVNVTANVAWTAAVTAGAANITGGPTPASGNNNQTITLVFPENTDQANTKEVTLRITGTGVTPAFYDVVFTQAKASASGTKTATFDFTAIGAAKGWSSNTPLTDGKGVFTDADITLTFDKGNHTTPPAWNGGTIRMYALNATQGNTLTVATSVGTISNIAFTYGATAAAGVDVSTGTFASPYATWTGDAASIVFSVYSTTGSSQQRHIGKVVVTYQ